WASLVAAAVMAATAAAATGHPHVTAAAQEMAAQPDAGPALQIRELTRRLVPVSDTEADNTTLLLGQIPDGLPLDLPLPTGSRVLGSAVRSKDTHTTSVSVLLDTVGAVPELTAYYVDELAARGWYRPPPELSVGIPG